MLFPFTLRKRNMNDTITHVMMRQHHTMVMQITEDAKSMAPYTGRPIFGSSVMDAMSIVPRHLFVPLGQERVAYVNTSMAIGCGQTISQPYIVALMTDFLDLKRTDVVLEIGTGSGYQAAVLSPLVKEVYTIEIVRSLAEGAGKLLKTLGYDNVTVKWGDGYEGWVEHAPFDCVIVTAAPGHIPQPLVDQLAVGGTMIIPVGVKYQELIVIQKDEEGISHESVMAVHFVPMTGEAEQ